MKDDDDNWRKAVAVFNELKLLVCRPIRWQLKSRRVNYYPASGTVTDDRFPRALPEHGLEALRRYLTRARERVPHAARPKPMATEAALCDLVVEVSAPSHGNTGPHDLIFENPQPRAAFRRTLSLILTVGFAIFTI
jgi:hypothetical protein